MPEPLGFSFGEQRHGGLVTRTWCDPCPRCGAEVTGLDATAIIVVTNEQAVIPLPNPACPWDEDDPDSGDCICSALINPAPDPMFDEQHVAGWEVTLHPCGHMRADLPKIYQETTAAPGTLGELMSDWAAGDDGEEGGRLWNCPSSQ